MDRDAEHLRLLSIFHYVVGGLAAFFGCFFVIYIIAGLFIANAPATSWSHNGQQQPGPPPAVLGWVFALLGGLGLTIAWLIAGLLAFGGYFLNRRKHYMFCLVAAGIGCLFMPLGTALGIFTIIVLQRPGVRETFTLPGTRL